VTETSPPAPALTEDQTSGALFVRWNVGALVIGLIALVIGGAIVRGQRAAARETPPASPAPVPGDR
jgi:ABC-type uncharacterized transport system permease subunit